MIKQVSQFRKERAKLNVTTISPKQKHYSLFNFEIRKKRNENM